jgi:hypothetical protein
MLSGLNQRNNGWVSVRRLGFVSKGAVSNGALSNGCNLSARREGWGAGLDAESRVLQKGSGGLVLLLEANGYAQQCHQDLWEFAVEIEFLRAAGLTNSDLRWLVSREFLRHAYEITTPEDARRRFRKEVSTRFLEQSCFILTPAGETFARRVFGLPAAASQPAELSLLPDTAVPTTSKPTPRWDSQRRELYLQGELVKQFKAPAANQEMILAAFEEEHWPPHIDDPLSPRADLDPKRRLHATINSLNRNQRRPLIRFLGDGRGEGVRWELSSSLLAASQPQSQTATLESNGHGAV